MRARISYSILIIPRLTEYPLSNFLLNQRKQNKVVKIYLRKLKALTFLTILVLALSLTTTAYASKDDNNGKHLAKGKKGYPSAQNGVNNEKSPVTHLYLYEKDPTTWEIVEDSAVGKLTILTHKDKYIFNARGLELEQDYALMYCMDPWAGEDSVEIDKGMSNDEGNLHLKGDWDKTTEGKIWLVLDADFDPDLDPSRMTGWNPTRYLFEYALLEPTG